MNERENECSIDVITNYFMLKTLKNRAFILKTDGYYLTHFLQYRNIVFDV